MSNLTRKKNPIHNSNLLKAFGETKINDIKHQQQKKIIYNNNNNKKKKTIANSIIEFFVTHEIEPAKPNFNYRYYKLSDEVLLPSSQCSLRDPDVHEHR